MTRRKWISGVVPGVLLLYISGSASASSGSGVQKTITLTAEPSSEVRLQALQATINSDGSVTLSGQDAVRLGEEYSYNFIVDVNKRTYKTTKNVVHSKNSEMFQTGVASGKKDVDKGVAAGAPITNVLNVTVYTTDPAFVSVVETAGYLTWVTSNSRVVWAGGDSNCQPYDPTTLGTHWYLVTCNKRPTRYTSGLAQTNVNSRYFNTDFLGRGKRTDSYHTLSINGERWDRGTYNYTVRSTGAFGFLLHGSVRVESCTRC